MVELLTGVGLVEVGQVREDGPPRADLCIGVGHSRDLLSTSMGK